MTVPDEPSRDSRSGASTSMTPKAMPARAISHMPITTWRSRSAGSAARRRCGASGRGAGTVNAIDYQEARRRPRRRRTRAPGPRRSPPRRRPARTARRPPPPRARYRAVPRAALAARPSRARTAPRSRCRRRRCPGRTAPCRAPGAAVTAEGQRRHAHQAQADQRHRPVTEPGDERSAGQRPDQRPCRVGADQDARARLGQPRRRGVVRQQRREGGEEDGVHPDDRADERYQPPQRRLQPGPAPLAVQERSAQPVSPCRARLVSTRARCSR